MPDLWKQSTDDRVRRVSGRTDAHDIDQYSGVDAGIRTLQPQREDVMADDETERYRQAAEDALQQLDWCIGYLHGIHKTKISAQLARNRSFIKRSLMKEDTEPLPTETVADG